MEDNQIKSKTLSNMIWRFAERCGAQGVAFVVSIVLARLLSPGEYGTVALITVFTSILQVFVNCGMGNALVQKKDADQLDFSSVFYFNVVMCMIAYAILYAIAPLIAEFYGNPSLTAMTRIVGLTIVIAGLKNVQQAYVSRNLLFRKFFFATLGGTIIAGIVGITMAYQGFGAWAIVTQQIVNTFIDTVILYITVRWRPTKEFSLERLKTLFGFGWKLLASSLLSTVYENVTSLIIGKFYSSEELAYYNKAEQIPNAVINNINVSIDSVLLPVMAREQDHVVRVKTMLRRSIKISSYIVAPIMIGVVFVADPLIRLLLTEKWLPCVLFLRIFCIKYMFYSINAANLNAIKAMGRSDLFLKLEIEKKIVGMAVILITMRISVEAMAYGLLVTSVLSQIINTRPNKKLLDYGYLEQMKDILPGILLAVTMGVCILPITLFDLSDVSTLILQILIGIIIYVGGSKLFKLESFYYIIDTITPFIRSRIKR